MSGQAESAFAPLPHAEHRFLRRLLVLHAFSGAMGSSGANTLPRATAFAADGASGM